jgi:hypothetical protein
VCPGGWPLRALRPALVIHNSSPDVIDSRPYAPLPSQSQSTLTHSELSEIQLPAIPRSRSHTAPLPPCHPQHSIAPELDLDLELDLELELELEHWELRSADDLMSVPCESPQ